MATNLQDRDQNFNIETSLVPRLWHLRFRLLLSCVLRCISITELGTGLVNTEQLAVPAAGAGVMACRRRRIAADVSETEIQWRGRWNVVRPPCPESAIAPVRLSWTVAYHLVPRPAMRQSTARNTASRRHGYINSVNHRLCQYHYTTVMIIKLGLSYTKKQDIKLLLILHQILTDFQTFSLTDSAVNLQGVRV